MAAIKYWLWLSSETGVSPQSKAALVSHYGDPERAFAAPEGEYSQVPFIMPADAKILEKRDLSRVDRIFELCEMHHISIITMQDAAYPERLKSISAPPVVLYVRGTLPNVSSEAAIAVIGTRGASMYGLKTANRMSAEICEHGGMILSGLTAGIDREAAIGCLSVNGVCIGVLGTAHDKEPGELERDIMRRGAVISEYPMGEAEYKSFFRDRNRITAGLSVGVLAVEAPEKSGTLLFAAEANDQGREIFAVPGNIDNANSVGTNTLIKQGAKLVTNGWEVMCEFEALYPGKLHEKKHTMPVIKDAPTPKAQPPKPVKEKTKEVENTDWREQLKKLSADQLNIITAIDRNASHTDEIIAATGMSAAKVLSNLTLLEIKGYIKREAGKKIVLNIAKK